LLFRLHAAGGLVPCPLPVRFAATSKTAFLSQQLKSSFNQNQKPENNYENESAVHSTAGSKAR
jgi:hypothetical protein